MEAPSSGLSDAAKDRNSAENATDVVGGSAISPNKDANNSDEEVALLLRKQFIQRLSLVQSITYGLDIFKSVLTRHMDNISNNVIKADSGALSARRLSGLSSGLSGGLSAQTQQYLAAYTQQQQQQQQQTQSQTPITLRDFLENGRSRFYVGDPLIFHVVRIPLRRNVPMTVYTHTTDIEPTITFENETPEERFQVFAYLLSLKETNVNIRDTNDLTLLSVLLSLGPYIPHYCCRDYSAMLSELTASIDSESIATTHELSMPEIMATSSAIAHSHSSVSSSSSSASKQQTSTTTSSSSISNKPPPLIPSIATGIVPSSSVVPSTSVTSTCGTCFDRLSMVTALLRHPNICVSGTTAAVSLPSFRFLPPPAYSSSVSMSLSSMKITIQPIELACMSHYLQAVELLLAHPQLTHLHLNTHTSQIPLLYVPVSESVRGKNLLELVLDYADIIHGEVTNYHGLSVEFESQQQPTYGGASVMSPSPLLSPGYNYNHMLTNFSPRAGTNTTTNTNTTGSPRKMRAKDEYDMSAHDILLHSLFRQDVELIQLLLEHGCELNNNSQTRKHPLQLSCYSILHMAVTTGNHHVVNALLEWNTNKSNRDALERKEIDSNKGDQNTNSGSDKSLSAYRRTSTFGTGSSDSGDLSAKDSNVGGTSTGSGSNKQTKIIRSPIELACGLSGDHYKVVSALIEHGAILYCDPRFPSISTNTMTQQPGTSPQSTPTTYKHEFNCLTIAAEAGNVHIVKFLIQFMRNSNTSGACQMYLGEEALILACKYGHIDVVKLLIENKFGFDVNEMKQRNGVSLLHLGTNNLLLLKYLVEETHISARHVCVPFYSAYNEFYCDSDYCASFEYHLTPVLHVAIAQALFPAVHTLLLSAKDLDVNEVDPVYGRPAVALLGTAGTIVGATRYTSAQQWEEELSLLPLLLTPVNSVTRDREGNSVLMTLLLRDRQWLRRCPQLAEVIASGSIGSAHTQGSQGQHHFFPSPQGPDPKSAASSSSAAPIPMLLTTLRLVNAYLDIVEGYDYLDGAAALISYGISSSQHSKDQSHHHHSNHGTCIRVAYDLIMDQWFALTQYYPATYLSDSPDHANTSNSGSSGGTNGNSDAKPHKYGHNLWSHSNQATISGLRALESALHLKTSVLHRLSALARKHRVAVALALAAGGGGSKGAGSNNSNNSVNQGLPLAFRKSIVGIQPDRSGNIPPFGKDVGRMLIPEEEVWCRDDVRITSIDTDDEDNGERPRSASLPSGSAEKLQRRLSGTLSDNEDAGSRSNQSSSVLGTILHNTADKLLSLWHGRSAALPQSQTPSPADTPVKEGPAGGRAASSPETKAEAVDTLMMPGTPIPSRLPPRPETSVATSLSARKTVDESTPGGTQSDEVVRKQQHYRVEFFDDGSSAAANPVGMTSMVDDKNAGTSTFLEPAVVKTPAVPMPLIAYPAGGLGVASAMVNHDPTTKQIAANVSAAASGSAGNGTADSAGTDAGIQGIPSSPLVRPTLEGTLLRKSDWLREWRPRYVLLYGSRLYVCNHPGEPPKLELELSKAKSGSNVHLNIDNTTPSSGSAIRGKHSGSLDSDDKDNDDSIPELRISGIKSRPLGLHFRSVWLGTRDSETQNAQICDLMRWMQAISAVA
jgi:ankyrin repeat protein